MTTVLAIDQGTSGTKAMVVDGDGNVLSVVELPVHPRYLSGGGVEQDPQELLDSVLDSGRQAVAEAAVRVDFVTLANQGETVLAWDPATGRPLTQAIVWQDRRSAEICAKRSDSANAIGERTGLVLDPYFSAPKMRWIREQVTTGGAVTTSDTWLIHQLTGEFVTDASTASRSLLTDLDSVSWDPELLEVFDLAGEALPRIAANDEVVGETTVFGGTAQVGGLVVDQQAALLAQRCLAPGEAKCTFGTGAFLLANMGRTPVRSSAGLAASVAWRVRDETSYCFDGQVATAASAVRWLQGLGLIQGAPDLDRVAVADSDGVLCVPALAGLSAPWWAPEAKATFSGMTLSTEVGHLIKAVLDGIAAQVAELADCAAQDIGEPLRRLRVDGGLTRSRVLMQAVADLLQVQVDVYPSAHATALGAAGFARAAADPGLPLEQAIIDWAPSTSFTPRLGAADAAEFRARWRAAVDTALMRDREIQEES
ncbi:glycerol kinase [Saccharopolyspora shandongensis]|uniref:ATP:glycerol 3-phosphotransferase n=1 Tax=Saccharopolyspora shandongensis TaxID=418495 RepID=A0A1H3GZL3_9PSEU|nr:FGGY family carbohydrate kinase [Saccharopolyspora shandongensis]SDY07974.1 glycerol kinase [Saccharopolyspora shandongensis]